MVLQTIPMIPAHHAASLGASQWFDVGTVLCAPPHVMHVQPSLMNYICVIVLRYAILISFYCNDLLAYVRLQEWKGHWQALNLRKHDLVFKLGHPPGVPCTSPVVDFKIMTLLDANGIHSARVQFCRCPGAPARAVQLLRASLWPATHLDPETAATFDVLQLFHTLNMIAQCNAYDFYQTLVKLTDPWNLKKLPVGL